MCLAVPMKIKEVISSKLGVVESDGAETRVSLALLKDPKVGEYVVVHAGYAIDRLDEKEANIRIELFNELSELNAQAMHHEVH